MKPKFFFTEESGQRKMIDPFRHSVSFSFIQYLLCNPTLQLFQRQTPLPRGHSLGGPCPAFPTGGSWVTPAGGRAPDSGGEGQPQPPPCTTTPLSPLLSSRGAGGKGWRGHPARCKARPSGARPGVAAVQSPPGGPRPPRSRCPPRSAPLRGGGGGFVRLLPPPRRMEGVGKSGSQRA